MTTPDDKALEAMCAQHVAGCVPCDNWKPFMHDSQMRIDDSCGHSNCCPRSMWPPKYLQNPAAVIELLEKEGDWSVDRDEERAPEQQYHISIRKRVEDGHGGYWNAWAPTFAKAGVLALLRARGVEVET